MKVDEIRERFLKFFEQRGHTIYPSDSLVPKNDPTLLFTGAGMNQFKEEFLGRVKGTRRAATCQKCLRTGDLENVGKTPDHHTFFEMLGNFSFGDYFKKEAIVWAWEFLTEELGLEEKGLWVSVYKDDDEAYNIWKGIIKVPPEKILRMGEKDNFWPANAPSEGPNGPCGPCSEIFYGSASRVEVWNLVFTQFDRKSDGVLTPLPSKNIDTGMGLERIARVMQGKESNFEIDSFLPIVDAIKEVTDVKGPGFENQINAIADHIRAVSFAIADGVFPSNEERGYVIRKLIRKAFWYGRALGLKKPFLYKLVPAVAKIMKEPYPGLTEQREEIAQVIQMEEKRFRDTIEEGIGKLNEIIDDSRASGILSGAAVFRLYDTYGFPLELIQEIALTENMRVDNTEFEKCMEKQRAKSREASKIKKSIFDSVSLKDSASTKITRAKTPFIEDAPELETKILLILAGEKERNRLGRGETGRVLLKETNFYSEKGGQVGDTGVLLKDRVVAADVINVVDVEGAAYHEVKVKECALSTGDVVRTRIDMKRREDIKRNHTATHILHSALRKVLGPHVKQAGSLVAPDRLRFDFTHFKALREEEILRVEDLVNEYIKNDSPVETRLLSLDEAKKEGAMALFEEKYEDKVRMVAVGTYSKELCGGTHVNRTGEITLFKIISESSIASGVRRIEAITGDAAYEKIQESSRLIKEIAGELKVDPRNIMDEIEKLSMRLKKVEKTLEHTSENLMQVNIGGLLKNMKKIDGQSFLVAEVKGANMGLLRKTADMVKERLQKGIFVLASEKDENLAMVVGLGALDKGQGMNAVEILNDIGRAFGIKGGGRPEFAQAGGRLNQDIKAVLKKSEEVLTDILKG